MRLILLVSMLVAACADRSPMRRPPRGKVGDCHVPRILLVVCASDGYEYVNPTEVNCARRKDRSLRIVKEGRCTGPPGRKPNFVGIPGFQPIQQNAPSFQPHEPQQQNVPRRTNLEQGPVIFPSPQQRPPFLGPAPSIGSPVRGSSPAFQFSQQGTPVRPSNQQSSVSRPPQPSIQFRPTSQLSSVSRPPQLSTQFRPSTQQNNNIRPQVQIGQPVFQPTQQISPSRPSSQSLPARPLSGSSPGRATIQQTRPVLQTIQRLPVGQQPTGPRFQGQLMRQQNVQSGVRPSTYVERSLEIE